MDFEKLILDTAEEMHNVRRKELGIQELKVGDEVLTPDFQTGYIEEIDGMWIVVGLDDGETWEGTAEQLGGYDCF